MKLRLQLLVMTLIFAGCSPKPETGPSSKVSIRFPASTNQSALRHMMPSGSRKAMFTSLNDIDCYAVAVSWNEGPDLPPAGSCGHIDIGIFMHNVRQVEGAVPDGGEMVIDIPEGPARVFQIIGYSATNGVCHDFKFLSQNDLAEIPEIRRVGIVGADVFGEFMDLEIDISMNGSVKLDKCQDGPFYWEQPQGTSAGGAGVWGQSNWGQATWGP